MSMEAKLLSLSAVVRVKFLTKTTLYTGAQEWRKRLPGGLDRWGTCVFLFDPDERVYDWLLVYEDLPAGHAVEDLACSPKNTIFVTSEPSSIKRYGTRFLSQFAYVITSQEPWAINHPGVIRSQSGMIWCYAFDHRGAWDYLVANPPLRKSGGVSTICSAKKGFFTPHRRRFLFTKKLIAALPEMARFGRGIRPIEQKADAIDPYYCHVAIENHIAPHHFTEKLIDGFLGLALPVYIGAPNVFDYFPSESVMPVDYSDPAGAAESVRRFLRDGEWYRRLPALQEARRRVLQEYPVYALVEKIINRARDEKSGAWASGAGSTKVLSRHELRRASWAVKMETGVEKTYGMIRSRWEQMVRPGLGLSPVRDKSEVPFL
jgi:hypothetical protein